MSSWAVSLFEVALLMMVIGFFGSFMFILGYMRATTTGLREALVQLFRNESKGGEA